VRVDLPKIVTGEVIGSHSLEVVVTAQGDYLVKSERLSREELSRYLATAGTQTSTVLIKADKRAALDRVFEVWDECRKAGLPAVHIATDTP
jgi:biopolymer transport protein ExbD